MRNDMDSCDSILQEYDRRDANPSRSPGWASLQSRFRSYDLALSRCGLLPLSNRRILDLGCLNGNWLDLCCRRWGADGTLCVGVDLRPGPFEAWRSGNPQSPITLTPCPAHQLTFEGGRFDVIHQSMMFSSIVDNDLRQQTASETWRVLKNGGHFLWYDFWINPLNRKTVGMRRSRVRKLFPTARVIFTRRITLAPPLARIISHFADSIVPWIESFRLLNSHYLMVLQKP